MNQDILKAYLFGALHDGTYNKLHKTWRISQSNRAWLEELKKMFSLLGYKSWIYREGKERSVSVIETTADFFQIKIEIDELKTVKEQIAYIRGYFDAEGGVPKELRYWMYIQLSQKNRTELEKICLVLESLGVHCGKIHNPSQKVDPNYWRFFISRKSHQDFIEIIGSFHPRKKKILADRLDMIRVKI
jgi:DNA-binding transcriptional regulator WhiA